MGNLIKLLIFAGIVYGIVWVYQNVDFNTITQDVTQKIQQEKTVVRVLQGRENAARDAQRVSE